MSPITIAQLRALDPCAGYEADRLEQIMGGTSIAVADALPVLLSLPRDDARWVLSRLLSRSDRVSWACDCAERIVDRITDPWTEGIALSAIQTARAWVEAEAEASAAYAAYAASAAYAAASASAAYAAASAEHEWQCAQALAYLEVSR